MSDKLQLVVKAGNTYLVQTEIPTFLHPLEVASYQPRRQAEACRTFRRCLHCSCKTRRPASAPCTWEEVERGEVAPRSFTIRNMAKRIENVGDLWSDLLKTKRSLRLSMERLEQML